MYIFFVCYHNKEHKVNKSWFHFFLICCFTIHFNRYKEPSYTSKSIERKKNKHQFFLRKTIRELHE